MNTNLIRLSDHFVYDSRAGVQSCKRCDYIATNDGQAERHYLRRHDYLTQPQRSLIEDVEEYVSHDLTDVLQACEGRALRVAGDAARVYLYWDDATLVAAITRRDENASSGEVRWDGSAALDPETVAAVVLLIAG